MSSDKVLIQPVIAYIVFSMQSGSLENIRNATLGFFTETDINMAKDDLWVHCGTKIIGEKKKRKETAVRSVKEANVTDIINACVQLDKSDCVPHIVISAKSLNCIPRSHLEELNNITLVDRLNRLEGRMLNMQTTLDGIVAENIVLKEHIANSTTYASKLSSTKSHQDKPSALSMKVGDPSLSQQTDVKQIKDCQQPDVRPKIRTFHASSAQNIPEGISISHLNQCPTVLSTDNACSSAQTKHSEDITDEFRLPTKHLKQMRRRERRQVIIGKGNTAARLKGAPEPGRDLFVFRLDSETTNGDIKAYLQSHNISVLKIDQISHENSKYKSFKVTVLVSSLNDLLKEEAWPTGVGVRRFRNIRKQHDEQN